MRFIFISLLAYISLKCIGNQHQSTGSSIALSMTNQIIVPNLSIGFSLNIFTIFFKKYGLIVIEYFVFHNSFHSLLAKLFYFDLMIDLY